MNTLQNPATLPIRNELSSNGDRNSSQSPDNALSTKQYGSAYDQNYKFAPLSEDIQQAVDQ